MSHPMQPSYRWNGEAEGSWDRVYWKTRVRTSSTTRSDPLSLTPCRWSCKTKEHQQRHRKNKSHNHTHTKREKFKCKKSREYVQEEKLSLLSREDRGQICSAKHQHHLL